MGRGPAGGSRGLQGVRRIRDEGLHSLCQSKKTMSGWQRNERTWILEQTVGDFYICSAMKKAEKAQTAQQIDLHILSTGFTAQTNHTMGSRMNSVDAGLRQREARTVAEWP